MLGLGLGLTDAAVRRNAGPREFLGSKLILWWDAEDPATLELSGSAVTGWTDKSAAFSVSQAAGASQPAYSATAVNNRPGVVFDGTDDFLTNAGTPTKVAAGNPREWWFLGTQTRDSATSGSHRVFRQGAAVTTGVQLSRSTSNSLVANAGDGATPQSATIASGFQGVVLVRQQITSTQLIVTLNDAATASFTMTPSLTNSLMVMGSREGASTFWQGAMNTLMQTEPLTAAEAAQMLAWLKPRGSLP